MKKNLDLRSAVSVPEIINLTQSDINPALMDCTIKVCYTGGNPNGTILTKETLTKMSRSIRGVPIVGAYNTEIEDFTDHGERLVFSEDSIEIKRIVTPVGFVPTDAKVWFQIFEEKDENTGETIMREYLLTQAYIWTDRFEEVEKCIDEDGKYQSMSLFEKYIDNGGDFESHKVMDEINHREMYMITNAVFDNLTILGEAVPPCFSGAGVIPTKQAHINYSLDSNFDNILADLFKKSEKIKEGGIEYTMEENIAVVDTTEDTVIAENTDSVDVEYANNNEAEVTEVAEVVAENTNTSFEKKEKEDEKEEEDKSSKENTDDSENKDEDEDEEKKKKYNLEVEQKLADSEAKYSDMEKKFNELNSKYSQLLAIQNQVEEKEKDKIISNFSMISEEDKREIIANRANYSALELEKELAYLGYKLGINLIQQEVVETPVEEEIKINTYSLNADTNSLVNDEADVPEYIKALRKSKKNNVL